MRIARFRHDGRDSVGIVSDGAIVPAGDDLFRPTPHADPIPLSDVRLLPPVVRGASVVCIGLNYRDHARETGAEPPGRPLVFAKLSSSLIGPGDPIVLPELSSEVDYEAELGVVIGRPTRNVTPSESLDHVLGYTCVNDVSARDLQLGDGQWTRGKSLDTFCPVGPWVVTVDDVPEPQDLGIRCEVNGQALQSSTTAEMIFGVAELVSFVSRGITLAPGDLIATGTPAGVGFTRDPPRFLGPGDVVRVEIDGVGALENPVVSPRR